MAVEIAQRGRLALHQVEHAQQHGMLEYVGMVAGVETVTVVHPAGPVISGSIRARRPADAPSDPVCAGQAATPGAPRRRPAGTARAAPAACSARHTGDPPGAEQGTGESPPAGSPVAADAAAGPATARRHGHHRSGAAPAVPGSPGPRRPVTSEARSVRLPDHPGVDAPASRRRYAARGQARGTTGPRPDRSACRRTAPAPFPWPDAPPHHLPSRPEPAADTPPGGCPVVG